MRSLRLPALATRPGLRAAALAVCALMLGGCHGDTRPAPPQGTTWAASVFASNGERIYFTATDSTGQVISHAGGPSLGMMMDQGRLACASCHGPGGRGGSHAMQTRRMGAPDIRWPALMSLRDEGYQPADSPEAGHQIYDLAVFRRAVVDGQHPDGNKLKPGMPRWDMNDTDLRDLLGYLKSLP